MRRDMGIYSERAQRLICLLFTLYEMPIGGPRKREAIEYIQRRGYLNISPEDIDPYISQVEPGWCTDIAFRRKDAVENELVFNQTRDCWELTRPGRELVERVIKACEEKRFDVRKCYLWTKYLKKALDPQYVPSSEDAQRPKRANRINWDDL